MKKEQIATIIISIIMYIFWVAGYITEQVKKEISENNSK